MPTNLGEGRAGGHAGPRGVQGGGGAAVVHHPLQPRGHGVQGPRLMDT